MSIVVCEPICSGLEHATINTNVIRILLTAYPDENVVCLAESDYAQRLLDGLTSSERGRVRCEPYKTPARHLGRLARLWQDIVNIRSLLRVYHREQARLLVFTSMCETTMLATWLARATFRRSAMNIVAIIHMQLRKIRWRSRNPFARIVDLTSAMRAGLSIGVRYCVLEYAIREEAGRIWPELANQILVLPHPVSDTQHRGERPATILENGLNIGFLGLASDRKGFGEFVRLAEYARKHHPGKAAFHVVGKMNAMQRNFDDAVFESGPYEEKLPGNEYSARIDTLHYVCVFLNSERYALSASGTLLDAFAFRKPVIAFNSPIVDDIFLKYGDIGYLCSDEKQLLDVVDRLLPSPDETRYQIQLENIERIAANRSPDILARQIVDAGWMPHQ